MLTIGTIGEMRVTPIRLAEAAIAIAATIGRDHRLGIAFDPLTGRVTLHDIDTTPQNFIRGLDRTTDPDHLADDIREAAVDAGFLQPKRGKG